MNDKLNALLVGSLLVFAAGCGDEPEYCDGDVAHRYESAIENAGGDLVAEDCAADERKCVERDDQAACVHASLAECASLEGADYLQRCSADGKFLLSCNLDVLYAVTVTDCSAQGASCVVTSSAGEAACQ